MSGGMWTEANQEKSRPGKPATRRRIRGILRGPAGFALGLAAILGLLFAPVPNQAMRGETATYSHFLYLPLTIDPLGGPARLGYGASVANLDNARLIPDLGFQWLKNQVSWASVQPSQGSAYNWANLDNVIAAGRAAGLKILLRVDGAPLWAHPANPMPTAPPDEAHLTAWGDFLAALAKHAGTAVQAYEVWNEPNLSYEWGDQPPSPAYYARLLQAGYPRLKSANSSAVVVSAGLATTGGDGGATSMNDVDFLNAMYAAGAKGNFDALGSHPYGFASSPDQYNPNGITDFRRVADQRQVMVSNGDGGKQVWATEFGWLLNSTCDWPDRNWQKVSEDTQAQYTARAYEVARTEWPWMGVMMVFNLDYATVPWYNECEPMRYYSMLSPTGTPRQVYSTLRAMAK